MNGESIHIIEQKLAALRKVLPEAFAEGEVDWERLGILVGGGALKDERYHLNWAGKTDAYRALQSPTSATLAPCRDESVGFDDAAHVFIEGENLAVLKVLQKSYFGKIKMIYIDPPYNTGNDHFIYPDRFAENKKAYQKRVGDVDAAGHLTREGLFRKNSRENGHYHSNWLSMIYPRLFLARNLLREDGVVFVSIDDNEAHNLRLVMNEIFGEENFVACLTVKTNPGGRDYGGIARTHEYVLCYSRSDGTELNAIVDEDKEFPMSDERGGFETRELRNRNVRFNSDNRPNLYYPFYVNKTACDSNGLHEVSLDKVNGWVEVYPLESRGVKTVWRWGKEKSLNNLNTEIMGKKKRDGAFQIVQKYRSKEKRERSILDAKCMRNEHGAIVLKKIFREKTTFDYPKSLGLIKRLVQLADGEDATILDFFAGSCITAHAVLDLNAEDGGNRQFICVQMPEECDEKSEARKAGYKTIADIGRERIRRVINNSKLNAGLKAFRLRESNFKQWRGDVKDADALAAQMKLHTDPLVDGAQVEDILYELLLKSGVALTAPLQRHDGWWLAEDAGAKIAVALERIDAATVAAMLAAGPSKVIALDRLFQGDDPLKTNTALQMRDAGVEFEVV